MIIDGQLVINQFDDVYCHFHQHLASHWECDSTRELDGSAVRSTHAKRVTVYIVEQPGETGD